MARADLSSSRYTSWLATRIVKKAYSEKHNGYNELTITNKLIYDDGKDTAPNDIDLTGDYQKYANLFWKVVLVLDLKAHTLPCPN